MTGEAVQGPAGPLLVLDGMSLAFRAWFALPPDLATADGVVTNALHGFCSMLLNLVRDHRPSGLAVAFDLPGPTFRDGMVEGYKSGRAETAEDLIAQFDMIRDVLGGLAIPVLGVPGYEADDVLATLASEARDRGEDVIVVTGDRDTYQLVEDPHVRVLYNRRGVSDYALYDEAGIEERTGVVPARYPLYAALRGDPSDNLPGVPGVGEKTAAKLVNEHGDVDTLYAHLDALSPKLRQSLVESEERVRRNLSVIPLVRDVPLERHVEQLGLGGWDRDEARRAFARYELRALWARAEKLMDAGLLGPPAGGAGAGVAPPPPAGAPGDAAVPAEAAVPAAGPGGAGAVGPFGAPPGLGEAWLDDVVVVSPATGDEARAALVPLEAAARAATGNVVLHGAWSGDPGRSPLAGLALVPELAGGMRGDGPPPPPEVLWIEGPLLADAGVAAALAAMLGEGGLGVVAHGAKELMRSLGPFGVDVPGLVMNPSVAAYLLDPSLDEYRIGDLASTYLGIHLSGSAPSAQGALDLPGADGAGGDPVVRGAARAAAVVALIRAPLTDALRAVGLLELHDTMERPLTRVLARMELIGIRVDTEELRSIADSLREEASRLEARVHELAGEMFNVNSVPQLRSVLYDEGKLGLAPRRKTKTGYSTDAATLEQLRDEHPMVPVLLRYREIEKLRSTYGNSLLAEVAADGRIHASFQQTVARTGRLSSDHPNLHNIPVRTEEGRRLRRAFVPSEGNRFLVADYDQIELRAIAHLSGDPGLRSAFEHGVDIHQTVASRVFGVPFGEVTPAQRSRAKMVSYGLSYGMEAYGLAQRLGVAVDEASAILQGFFAGFPEVRQFMEDAVAEARERGFTTTAFGRRRPLPDLRSPNHRVRQAAERQAMNAGVQGLAADLFKMALIRLDGAIEEGGLASRLVLQVHDEVIVDVVPGEEDAAAGAVRDAMVGAADLSVPLAVEMSWGSSWAEAKAG